MRDINHQMLSQLIFDVKLCIASADEVTWYLFYRRDREFAQYASSEPGKHAFIARFTEIVRDCAEKYVTKLFGKIHSIYDEPAILGKYGGFKWCWGGKLYRKNGNYYALSPYGSPAYEQLVVNANGCIAYFGELASERKAKSLPITIYWRDLELVYYDNVPGKTVYSFKDRDELLTIMRGKKDEYDQLYVAMTNKYSISRL